MFSLKFAALAAALGGGALALGGCHADRHYHDRHAYRYERDWCDDDHDWHRHGDHYRYRDYGRHRDWHDAGYYHRGRYDR